MFQAQLSTHLLEFKKPARTSRNTLNQKSLYVLRLSRKNQPAMEGWGEISPFAGLSLDDVPEFPVRLKAVVQDLNDGALPDELDLESWPSIRFGLETALADLATGGIRQPFPSAFSRGEAALRINGLIWMDSRDGMFRQVEEKIAQGFDCIKMKIGALDFDEECRLLEQIRKKYSAFRIELRVDANGAFPASDALAMLQELKRFELHSIEQPVRAGQPELMQELCTKSPLAIALDEELLGLKPDKQFLEFIRAPYLILKPGLLGGFGITKAWIDLARETNTGWWMTSALESNIGLNAIAQFASQFDLKMPQGLGTGQLYTNNITSPLRIENGHLHYQEETAWGDLPKAP